MTMRVDYERHPDLYFYGIDAFAIKVPKREILLQLPEEQFDLLSFPVNSHDVFGIHVHVIGKELYESCPCLLPGLGMPTDSLGQEVGEEAYRDGVNDPQPFEPFRVLAFPAIR